MCASLTNLQFVHEDGSTFDGVYVADQRSGRGVLSFADGSSFEGDFGHGHMHGLWAVRGAGAK